MMNSNLKNGEYLETYGGVTELVTMWYPVKWPQKGNENV